MFKQISSSAAALCLNSTNGGQSDWYLPSIDELSLLWHNRFNVNKVLSMIGGSIVGSGLSTGYASSTESASSYVCVFLLDQGAASVSAGKWFAFNIRAVRAF
jgi:hypothetical protein